MDKAALAALDRAIFGPPPAGQGFDAGAFRAALTGRGARRRL